MWDCFARNLSKIFSKIIQNQFAIFLMDFHFDFVRFLGAEGQSIVTIHLFFAKVRKKYQIHLPFPISLYICSSSYGGLCAADIFEHEALCSSCGWEREKFQRK